VASQITKTLYPALTQSNFKNYVKASRARRIIVDEKGDIHRGETYWSQACFDGFVLPAQGKSKPYQSLIVKSGFLMVATIPNNTQKVSIMLNINRRLAKLLIVHYVMNHGLIDKQTEALEDL